MTRTLAKGEGRLSKSGVMEWLTAGILYLSMLPFFVWPLYSYKTYLFVLPLTVLLFLNRNKNISKAIPYVVCFVFITILSSLGSGSNIFGLIVLALISFVFFPDKLFILNVFKKLKVLYALIIGLSLISWIYVVLLGGNLPSTVIPPLNPLKDHEYYAFPFFVMPDAVGMIEKGFRFFGPFDEPGAVGTACLLFLSSERYRLNNIWNIILLLAGIFSLSLFFYLASAIYLFIYIFMRKGVKNSIKLSVVLVFVALALVSTKLEITQVLIWNRLEWNESSRSIEGDNRASDDLKTYIQSIRGTSQYFFGGANKATIERFAGDCSLYNSILKYGMVAVSLFFLFFLVMLNNNIRGVTTKMLVFITIFITCYNRPGIFDYAFLMLFSSLIYSFSYQLPQKRTMGD